MLYTWRLPFNCSYTFRSKENKRIVARLIDEVQGLNQDFMMQHIRGSQLLMLQPYIYSSPADASYRFYRSKCEEASITKRGLLANKQKTKRRHERLARVGCMMYRHTFVYNYNIHFRNWLTGKLP